VIRVFWVTILLYLLFKPKLSSLNKWKSSLIWISALFYSLSAITQYFAISKVGIVMTVLSLALMPIIVYFSSYFILKEKVTITQIISSIIIMSCVFTAAIFS
jgi:drug/metabolite transporter (DMT)-like permease